MSRLSTRRKEGLHATNSLPSPMISRLGPILRTSVVGSGAAGGSRAGGLQAPSSTFGGSGHGSSLGLPGVGGSGNISHDADVESVDSDRLAVVTMSTSICHVTVIIEAFRGGVSKNCLIKITPCRMKADLRHSAYLMQLG
jgi:hypothetical protein